MKRTTIVILLLVLVVASLPYTQSYPYFTRVKQDTRIYDTYLNEWTVIHWPQYVQVDMKASTMCYIEWNQADYPYTEPYHHEGWIYCDLLRKPY